MKRTQFESINRIIDKIEKANAEDEKLLRPHIKNVAGLSRLRHKLKKKPLTRQKG